jgi:site-specific recombinase XerD
MVSLGSGWDWERARVTFRQTKADCRSKFTTRSVPIDADLAAAVKPYLDARNDGHLAFVQDGGDPIGEKLASRWFRDAVDGSPTWKYLHGWHVFRHSLASNMAAAGVDSRELNGILGHSTGEMERRYRHLCPRRQADVLAGLFRSAPAD